MITLWATPRGSYHTLFVHGLSIARYTSRMLHPSLNPGNHRQVVVRLLMARHA